jgi:hypothetical protein
MQPRVRDSGTFLRCEQRHGMPIQTSRRMPIGDESMIDDQRLRLVSFDGITCYNHYAHVPPLSSCARTTMIGAPEPLEIAKLCGRWRADASVSSPCRQRPWNPFLLPDLRGILTLRLHSHSVLFSHCTAGILLQASVPPKLRDAIPPSEPHSNARSRQDLRPRCSTILRMSLYFKNQRDLQSSLHHSGRGSLWRP